MVLTSLWLNVSIARILFINNIDFSRWFTTFVLGKLDIILCEFYLKLLSIKYGCMCGELLRFSEYMSFILSVEYYSENPTCSLFLVRLWLVINNFGSRLVNSDANVYFNQILSSSDSRGCRQLAKECFSYFTFHVFYDQ